MDTRIVGKEGKKYKISSKIYDKDGAVCTECSAILVANSMFGKL